MPQFRKSVLLAAVGQAGRAARIRGTAAQQPCNSLTTALQQPRNSKHTAPGLPVPPAAAACSRCAAAARWSR
eukprot:258462-Chlamydomonas_euryale.AAC.1